MVGCMESPPSDPESRPYAPDCDIVERDDGSFLVTHLESGRALTAATDRQALIVGTGLAIAHTWQQAAGGR